MRKSLILLAALLVSTQAFATYFIVLKDGSQIRAKSKWTVVGGKAIVQLESGGTMALDPKSIDAAKSEETTKLGGASVLAVEQTQTAPAQQQPSTLGGAFKLRKLANEVPTTTAPATDTAPVASGPMLSPDVISRFEAAYENVGIFEHTLKPTGPHSLRAELTADNEEAVFNAISATSFLIVRNAGVSGAQVDSVELFMKTTTGGSAGRFQMNRDDAAALDNKSMTTQEYFVRKVLY
ncbi:MAG TPA: hypothetical protein VL284_18800 [Thermoanaerobaculia bacterium]|nr:hypothetical protein [Thermoanaerobaculia bacterium]